MTRVVVHVDLMKLIGLGLVALIGIVVLLLVVIDSIASALRERHRRRAPAGFDINRHDDRSYIPPAPWTAWEEGCWTCRWCGAAAGFQVHSPSCPRPERGG